MASSFCDWLPPQNCTLTSYADKEVGSDLLESYSPACMGSSRATDLELSISSGWMWPQQDTSLSRKDAWTQTYPPRRRIRSAQVQGAGWEDCKALPCTVSADGEACSPFCLMAPDCKWKAPRLEGASCSSLALCTVAHMQKEARESNPGCNLVRAACLYAVSCSLIPCPHGPLRRTGTPLL
ncbi:hypothetical protein U0070_012441 [Myodes glareolus]|uniref:Uncharacterized protein n=1 Tax=Myodes glareolus TaxID=447135 RepID=A0AAW0HMC5_MYOGA